MQWKTTLSDILLWRKGGLKLEQSIEKVAQRCRPIVLKRIDSLGAIESRAELCGYIRARAASILQSETKSAPILRERQQQFIELLTRRVVELVLDDLEKMSLQSASRAAA